MYLSMELEASSLAGGAACEVVDSLVSNREEAIIISSVVAAILNQKTFAAGLMRKGNKLYKFFLKLAVLPLLRK